MTAIHVGGHAMPGVNTAMREAIIYGDALQAADALPPGSARTVVAELREATLKLLGLGLQRVDRVDEDAETLDRCQAVGHLSVGGLREILEAADHVLGDRHWVTRADVDEHAVSDGRANEFFQFSERRDDSLDRIGPLIESLCKLVGELQIVRDPAGVKRFAIHSDTPRVARALTRHVTGAIVAASRWLQRRAWVRRVAATAPRPSGTTSREASA